MEFANLNSAQKFLHNLLPKLEEKVRNKFDSIISYNKSSGESIKERSKGFYKRAVQFQNLIVIFSYFFKTYSGVFGNVVFAALFLLFATVKAKAEAEAFIQLCILYISNRMPDLKMYKRIYFNLELGCMLLETYSSIVIFAQKATIYFQAHGFIRYMHTSNRISEKCSVLLAEKINHFAKNNKMIRKTEKQFIFRHESTNNKRLQKVDAQHFLNTAEKQYWKLPGRILMVFFGRNKNSSSSNQHFEADDFVAYESVSRDSTLERTLLRLIFQLLEKAPAVVERAEDYGEIESQIAQNKEHCNKDEGIKGLCKALLHIIDCCNSCVYIILNRPELCEAQSEKSCTKYIATMLSLVKNTQTDLKIMVVVRNERWDFEKNKDKFRRFDREIFHKVRMDQGRA
ncbi:hypothetical protein GGR58DRAFT_515340 [Xylaria digitata]|nr:hypothetical protein GGR58DRAFT_515340 [Xylaria digitata]